MSGIVPKGESIHCLDGAAPSPFVGRSAWADHACPLPHRQLPETYFVIDGFARLVDATPRLHPDHARVADPGAPRSGNDVLDSRPRVPARQRRAGLTATSTAGRGEGPGGDPADGQALRGSNTTTAWVIASGRSRDSPAGRPAPAPPDAARKPPRSGPSRTTRQPGPARRLHPAGPPPAGARPAPSATSPAGRWGWSGCTISRPRQHRQHGVEDLVEQPRNRSTWWRVVSHRACPWWPPAGQRRPSQRPRYMKALRQFRPRHAGEGQDLDLGGPPSATLERRRCPQDSRPPPLLRATACWWTTTPA